MHLCLCQSASHECDSDHDVYKGLVDTPSGHVCKGNMFLQDGKPAFNRAAVAVNFPPFVALPVGTVEQMVCFVSRPVSEFPKGIIRDFLQHAQSEQSNPTDRLGLVGEDRFDSKLEEYVCHDLRSRGLTVYTQVPCSNFQIDMVAIDGEGRRLAIECDGDFHYEEGDILRPEDYQRQDIIERSGWVVHRIPARRYYSNPKAAIDLVLEELLRQPTDSDFIDDGGRPPSGPSTVAQNLPTEPPNQTDSQLSGEPIHETETSSEQAEVVNASGDQPPPEIPDEKVGCVVEAEIPNQFTLNRIPWDKNVWFALAHWGKHSGSSRAYTNSFCYKLGIAISRGYNLTDKQINYAVKVWNDALEHGFKPSSDTVASGGLRRS